MRTKPIGTGPFKFVEFKQYDSIRLVRNPDYFKPGKPHLDGIEFHIVPSPSTALLSFVAGRFDITFPWEVTIPQLRDVTPPVAAGGVRDDVDEQQHQHPGEPRSRPVRQARYPPRAGAGARPPGLHRHRQRGRRPGRRHHAAAQRRHVGHAADRLAAVPGYGPDVEKNRAGCPRHHGPGGLSARRSACALKVADARACRSIATRR